MDNLKIEIVHSPIDYTENSLFGLCGITAALDHEMVLSVVFIFILLINLAKNIRWRRLEEDLNNCVDVEAKTKVILNGEGE